MTYKELLSLDGRKVTAKRGKRLINAEISVVDNEVYLLQNEWDGEYNIDYKGYKCASVPMYSFDNYGNGWSNIKLLDKTMKNLEVGDLLIDDGGYFRKVLEVVGEMVFISVWSKDRNSNVLKKAATFYSVFDLEEKGYKLAPTEEETIEIEGKRYKKEDVKERLSELEEVK